LAPPKRSENEVRERARERDGAHAYCRAKARLVERDGLPITEAGENDEQRSERIEMRHRVQAHPAHEPGGVVAQPVRGVRVHELVDGDAQKDGDDEAHEPDRILSRPLDRRDQAAAQPGVRQ